MYSWYEFFGAARRMEIQIVVSTDNTFFARLARRLGARWTHAMLRFCICCLYGFDKRLGCLHTYKIIEAGFRHGVIERPWNPDEYTAWAVYELTDAFIGTVSNDILLYARGNIGKRYAFERLPLLIPRFIKKLFTPLITKPGPVYGYLSFLGTGHICTSLVDDCFLHGAGIDLVAFSDVPWVLADDIADSPLLEMVEQYPERGEA